MQHLGLLFALTLILVNFWGVTLVTGLIWKNRWLALAAGPWLATTAFYAVESYHGLGDLRGIGLLGTITSLGVIWLSATATVPARLPASWGPRLAAWREEFSPRRLLEPGLVFVLVTGYALGWRFTYPNVDGSSEKLADFSYICSYYSGATLPVMDAWLHPYLSTQYYSFQHYAAALLGRVIGLPPGSAYNIGFCVLIGLGGATFAGGVWLACSRRWIRWAILAGFVLGGSGLSGLVHLVDKGPSPWSSMRFIGSAPLDREPLGPMLKAYTEMFPRMELPGEPFSYSIYLGDYHAPLSSYLLVGLAVISMLLWQRDQRRRYAALVGGTLTWTLLANTWSLPLQGIGVAAWVLKNHRDFRSLVPWLAAGAAAVWMASWVYLSAFTTAASGYGTALRLVPWDEHTPPLLLLLFLLPTLGLSVLGWLSGNEAGRWLGKFWLLMVAFTEFVYVDDIYSGMFNRFNTSLKWWPLVAAGALLTLGPIVLERTSRRWVRITGLILCLYPCSFVYDLALNWRHGNKEAAGKIEGHHFLTKDMFPRVLLGRLKLEPAGVVIERPQKDAFTNSACLPLFAGHRMWLGWLGHEQLWRGYREDLPQRQQRLFEFFNGEMPDPLPWLQGQGIDYVLWYQEGDTTELWRKLHAKLSPGYLWVELFTHEFENGTKLGYWKAPAAAVPAGAR
ncbi:MAG: hypothetical protein JNJ82_17995 [Opitutaceae bacterium]|nr:hypothetical protein [Opitutaceae bacterium]